MDSNSPDPEWAGPLDFYLDKNIEKIFTSNGFKLKKDYYNGDIFRYNICFAPPKNTFWFQGSYKHQPFGQEGPSFNLYCKDSAVPNNVYSNKLFLENFLSIRPKEFDDIIYNYIEYLLDNVYSRNRYHVLEEAVNYIPIIKEKLDSISASLSKIQKEFYHNMNYYNIISAENINNEEFSAGNCSDPIWARILNCEKGIHITVSDHHLYIEGTHDRPFKMPKPVTFDGTIRGFLKRFGDIVNNPNLYNISPRIKSNSLALHDLIDSYNAIDDEIKIIAKEVYTDFKERESAIRYHFVLGDSETDELIHNDQLTKVCNEVDYLLGEESLKLTKDVSELMDKSNIVCSIGHNSRFDFKIKLYVSNDYVSNLTQNIVFDGTDNGLVEAIQKQQEFVKTEDFVKKFSKENNLKPKFVQELLPQISNDLANFGQSVQKTIERRDFRKRWDMYKKRVETNDMDLEARGELYKMQKEASKYGITEQPVKLKTIDDLKPKKKKYESSIFR